MSTIREELQELADAVTEALALPPGPDRNAAMVGTRILLSTMDPDKDGLNDAERDLLHDTLTAIARDFFGIDPDRPRKKKYVSKVQAP